MLEVFDSVQRCIGCGVSHGIFDLATIKPNQLRVTSICT